MGRFLSFFTAWWRGRGLRSRVTMTAAAGLLVAFLAADLLLFSALRISLTRTTDSSARQAAGTVVALINSQPLPDPVPVAGGAVTIQVLAPDGRIIDVSAGADRLVPLLPVSRAIAAARSQTAVSLNGSSYGLPSQLRVVAARAADGSVVVAAVPYSSAHASLDVVRRALWIGTPLTFLLFTGAIWAVVGSTLRPITLLRRGAASVAVTGVPPDRSGPPALPVPVARDEVRLLALTLNGMLTRLFSAQQRQRDLVSDTAHELRSPIASIRTQLEVALDHPGLQDWSETARDVHADVLRLARLAEDLLVLARLDDSAAGHPDRTAISGVSAASGVDLSEVGAAVVQRYAGARVPVALSEAVSGPVLVRGDNAALDRVLVNLIDNACRYAKSRVTVEVRSLDDGFSELTVTDDGPGIPVEDLERAFERFTRLDPARTRGDGELEGAGLGLAIVRATAQSLGGTARLEPAVPAPGLRAVVRVPTAE